MTEEEKQLLLKDLATRVPYKVIVEQTLFPSTLADKEQRLKSVQANDCVQLYWYKYINEFVPIHCIKPYLRPMSSMTEEEINEFILISDTVLWLGKKRSTCILSLKQMDWLNKKCLTIVA